MYAMSADLFPGKRRLLWPIHSGFNRNRPTYQYSGFMLVALIDFMKRLLKSRKNVRSQDMTSQIQTYYTWSRTGSKGQINVNG